MTSGLAARREPVAFLRQTGVFGDLADDPRFADAFTAQLRSLQDHGARGAVRRLQARRSDAS